MTTSEVTVACPNYGLIEWACHRAIDHLKDHRSGHRDLPGKRLAGLFAALAETLWSLKYEQVRRDGSPKSHSVLSDEQAAELLSVLDWSRAHSRRQGDRMRSAAEARDAELEALLTFLSGIPTMSDATDVAPLIRLKVSKILFYSSSDPELAGSGTGNASIREDEFFENHDELSKKKRELIRDALAVLESVAAICAVRQLDHASPFRLQANQAQDGSQILSSTEQLAADFIASNPGCPQKVAAAAAGVEEATFRKHLWPKLKAVGFTLGSGGRGCFAPRE